MLPIRVSPVLEKWDCHGCGRCCRGTMIRLNDDDFVRIRNQDWEHHPDYLGRKIVVKLGRRKPEYYLAKRKDGSCIFLDEDGLCRIHRELGLEAKPLVCRMAPLQLVPREDFFCLTLRRYCPSAAADEGRPVEEHLEDVRRMAEQASMASESAKMPPVVRNRPDSAQHASLTLAMFDRILRDERFPMVRRLVHGLNVCDHLERCRLERLSSEKAQELFSVLENSAQNEASAVFEKRWPPRPASAMLFRQTALEYLRLYPKFVIEQSWRERWRLVVAALAFARGRGVMPKMHDCFPATTFEALERPLGPLEPTVLQPLTSFYEATAASEHYALMSRPGWSLVESYRSLALTYALGMWLLRLITTDRTPEPADMIEVVCTLDRGQSFPLLAGARHRRRVRHLARHRELAQLLAWYAR